MVGEGGGGGGVEYPTEFLVGVCGSPNPDSISDLVLESIPVIRLSN